MPARDLLIRELTPADRPALLFLFGRLGPQSRYQRFLTGKRELTAADLNQLTNVDHWHHEAVLALSPVPRAPVGVARYVRGQDFDQAEVAVTVVDAWQRRGVGSQLLAALKIRALQAGIRVATASLLRDNRGALALARTLGPWTVRESYGAMIEIQVSWAPPCAPGAAAG